MKSMRRDVVGPPDPEVAEAYRRFWESLVDWNPETKGTAWRAWATPTDRKALRQARIDALAAKVGTPESRRAYARRHRELRRIQATL